jgi:hypothetical protein
MYLIYTIYIISGEGRGDMEEGPRRVSGRFWRGLAIGIPLGVLLWALAFAALFGLARYGPGRYQHVSNSETQAAYLLDTQTGTVFRPYPFPADDNVSASRSLYWVPFIRKEQP